MKPITLTIQGLNSFEAPQTIHFDQLTAAGLFGIFGKTGSGKTTIIDAITLALYGKMSGGREKKMFVNANSPLTAVSLTFAINENIYVAERVYKPNKDRTEIKSTPSGTRLMNQTTDTILATGKREVDSAIIPIIGLEYEDFSRTVVLPQGKFSEFLNLTGTGRREMLERIFDLEPYGDRLSTALSEEEKKQDTARLKLTNKLELLGNPTPENIQMAQSQAQTLTTELIALETTLKNLTQKKFTLTQAKENHDQLLSKDKQLTALHSKAPQFKEKQHILTQITHAKAGLPQITALEETTAQLTTLTQTLAHEEKQLATLTQKEQTLAKKQQAFDLAQPEHTKRFATKQLIRQRQEDLKEKATLDQARDALRAEFNTLKKESSMLDQTIATTKDHLVTAQQSHNQLLEILTNQQSSYIAQVATLLTPHKPCPVCGSPHHPAPYTGTDAHAFTDLDALKSQSNQLKIRTEQLTAQLEHHQAQKQTKALRMQAIKTQGTAITEKLTALDDKLKSLTGGKEVNTFLAQLDQALDAHIQLETALKQETQTLATQRQTLTQTLATLSGELGVLTALKNTRTSQCDTLLQTHGFTDATHLKTIASHNPDQLTAELDTYHQQVNELTLICNQLKAHDYTGLDQLPALLIEETATAQLIQEKTEALSLAKNLALTLSQNLEAHTQLTKEQKAQEKALDTLTDLKNLLKGKQFVEFVAKKQLAYIAKEAHDKILDMTLGGYGLTLIDTDFYILDYKNGGIHRHPSTLSGGETFMVSLCLALALSSKIQLKRGASLDFFFLDEGFGTLDMDTLDTVMDILTGLPNQNRAVGVISHVEEMKARIDHKLTVNKEITGASVVSYGGHMV